MIKFVLTDEGSNIQFFNAIESDGLRTKTTVQNRRVMCKKESLILRDSLFFVLFG